jgi:hypothetical protein
MTATAAPFYDRAAQRIEHLMVQGTPFAQVEEAIDTAAAPQDQRAALWLLAWSLRARSPQPREAHRRRGAENTLDLGAP